MLYSGAVQKWNNLRMKQDRSLVITNLNIYNFKKKSKIRCQVSFLVFRFLEVRRVISIKTLAGLTKLLYKKGTGPNEFVIHVKKSHDYRMLSEE